MREYQVLEEFPQYGYATITTYVNLPPEEFARLGAGSCTIAYSWADDGVLLRDANGPAPKSSQPDVTIIWEKSLEYIDLYEDAILEPEHLVFQ